MNKSRHIFTVVLAAVGGALLLAGAALFLVGLALEGWDVGALTSLRYEQRSYTAAGEIHTLSLRLENARVRVEVEEGAERVTLSYPVPVGRDGEQTAAVEIAEADGTLTVEEGSGGSLLLWGLIRTPEAVLTLPAGRYERIDIASANGGIAAVGVQAAALTLEASNGDIRAEGTDADELSLRTGSGDIRLADVSGKSIAAQTDAGDIAADGAEAEGALELCSSLGDIEAQDAAAGSLSFRTNAGSISLDGARVAGEASLQTDLGEIRVRGATAASAALTADFGAIDAEIDAQTVRLESGSGEIRARLAGDKEDYTIRVQTGLGSCNVVDRDGGGRSLTAVTELGSIRVDFTG